MARAGTLVCLAVAAALSCVGAAAQAASVAQSQAPLGDLRARLTTLRTTLSEQPLSRDLPLDQLLRNHGLDNVASRLAAQERARDLPVVARDRAGDMPARAEPSDLRLALSILSQAANTDDNRDVLLALGTDTAEVVSFRGGVVTLSELEAAGVLARTRGQPSELRRPVVLWEDTTLRLTEGQHVALSRPGGAFLISFGKVEIIGATLSVAGGPNVHSPDFIPFLSVGGGGVLTMERATVRDLGFRWTGKFAGVSIMAHPFMPAQGVSRIERSHFDNIVTLALTGATDVRVLDNRFHDMRDAALLITRGPRAQVQGNLFFGAAPTNAIRILDGSSDAVLSGNLLMDGQRAGILVDRGSDRVRVVGNVIWRRDGSAIKFMRTACGRAALNIALDGRQKGIEVRQSPGTVVQRNLISGSHSSAIWISAQPRGAVTHLSNNILSGNGQGLETATAARIAMSGNDFSAQMPRLVSGDLVPQNAVLARDLKGQEPMILTASGKDASAAWPAPCSGGVAR